MQIKGFIRSSLLEWEGKLAAVVFLPRCNLRCRYCHAAHLVLNPDELESLSRSHVLEHLRSQAGWLDGVAITGGEPTLHGEELLELIAQIRERGLEVMVETNGTRPDRLAELIQDGHVDALSMDVKAPLTSEDYGRVAGVDVDVEAVRRSVQFIKTSGLPHEFRVTVVPGLVGREEVEGIGPELEGACTVAIQNFKPDHCLDESLREVPPYRPEELEVFEAVLRPFAHRVAVRGKDNRLRTGT